MGTRVVLERYVLRQRWAQRPCALLMPRRAANGGLDLDYLLSGLADDEQTALWNEVNHYLYWMKYKKFLPVCILPICSHDRKPGMNHYS